MPSQSALAAPPERTHFATDTAAANPAVPTELCIDTCCTVDESSLGATSPAAAGERAMAVPEDFPLSFELSLFLFLAAVWALEVAAQRAGVAPLLGQVIAGIVLGPSLVSLAPFPDALKLLGKVGVMALVVESALAVDLRTVRKVGLRAFLAAATGVVGPVLLTLLVLSVGFGSSWQVGLAAGAALAPTSLGFSAQLLGDRIATPSGQLICTTAVIDDVLSLLLLAEVQALGGDGGEVSAWDIVAPVTASVGSIVVGIALAVLLEPKIRGVAKSYESRSWFSRGLMCCLFLASALFALVCKAIGSSDLLGCFFGGLLFSSVPRAEATWDRQMKRFTRWGAALFFACTVAFEVPEIIQDEGGLFSGAVLLRGFLLSVAAVAGKFLLGFYAVPLTWVEFNTFGWAMNGRGEFSFLIAAQAASEGLLDQTTASSVVWGLLVSTFLAPLGFRMYLAKEAAREESRTTGRPDSLVAPGSVAAGDAGEAGEGLQMHAVNPVEPNK